LIFVTVNGAMQTYWEDGSLLLRPNFKWDFLEEVSPGAKDINAPWTDFTGQDLLGTVGAPIAGTDWEAHPSPFRFLVVPHMGDLGVLRGAKNAGKAIEPSCLRWKLVIYAYAGEVHHIDA
jgi:hypothetical protein